MLRVLSVGAVAMLGLSGVATVIRVPNVRDVPRDSVAEERAYAVAVASIADSAIRRLDFFPARAQLLVQTAFLATTPDPSIPFDDLAARRRAASVASDAAVERLADVSVPSDLKQLNAQLVNALKAATRASA